MPVYTDQMQQQVRLEETPTRIISLVPSQTELLYYLGLDEEVVGQTLFCIHPATQHAAKPRVGGTKKLKIEEVKDFTILSISVWSAISLFAGYMFLILK